MTCCTFFILFGCLVKWLFVLSIFIIVHLAGFFNAPVLLVLSGLFFTLFYLRKIISALKSDDLMQCPSALLLEPSEELTIEAPVNRNSPDEELAFISGGLAILEGNDTEALLRFKQASGLADGAFLAGVMAIKAGQPELAVQYFSSIKGKESELNLYVSKHLRWVEVMLPPSDGVRIELTSNYRGFLLALSYAQMQSGCQQEALVTLKELYRSEPQDTAIKLVLAEWLLRERGNNPKALQKVLALAEGATEDTTLEAALILCRAKALQMLGRPRKALAVLTRLRGRKADRPGAFHAAVDRERIVALTGLQQPAAESSEHLSSLPSGNPHFVGAAFCRDQG
jgi:hypothetical protein